MPWLTPHATELLADWAPTPTLARRPEQWRVLCDPVNSLVATLEIRNAARHGIENRRPFRDRRLIELALQMPAHLFYRPGKSKWILRELGAGLLPEKTRTRTWTSSLSPLFIRGLLERELKTLEDLLWSRNRFWPAMVREDWMRANLERLKAGAPDGVVWVVLWRAITYEIWRRRENYSGGEP